MLFHQDNTVNILANTPKATVSSTGCDQCASEPDKRASEPDKRAPEPDQRAAEPDKRTSEPDKRRYRHSKY